MVSVSFIGRKKKPFYPSWRTFMRIAFVLFGLWSKLKKNHVLRSEMSILRWWIRFGSMFVRRLAALHIQGLGGKRVLGCLKKKNKTNKNKQNKNEEESKQWKLIRNIYLTTVALFTFRNCIKDLWDQKLTPPAMDFILSLIMVASYWINFLTIKYTFGLE